MQMCHSGVDIFIISQLNTKAPDTTVVDRSRRAEHALCPELLMLWCCTFHRMISCLHVDFECFKLALWPTLRQKLMNFRSIFTRPGDNDEKISNCSLTPKLVHAHNSAVSLMIFFQTFLMTRLPISWWFLGKYHSEMKCFFVW